MYPHSKQRRWGRANKRHPNTSSINTLASKIHGDEPYYQQVSLYLTFVCVLPHMQNCRRQEGKKNLRDFHLARALVWSVQILVSVTEFPLWAGLCSPCMPCLLQPSSSQEPTLYSRLLMSHWLPRHFGSDLSLPPTWQQPGSQHLWNEGQDRWDLAWVWDQRPSKSSTGPYRVEYEQEDRQLWTDHLPQKALQLRLLHFIIHTLFPFYLGFTHGFRIRICW